MAYCCLRSQTINFGISCLGLLLAACSTHTVTSAPSPPSPTVEQSLGSAVPKLPVENEKSLPLSTPAASPAPTVEANQDPTILNKIRKNLREKVAIAKQDTGKTYLSSLLLSQQAEKLVKGAFTSDLKVLASDIPIETEEYRLEVRQVDASKAVMVALAKKPGFASYTGAVYAVEGSIPVTGMCRTNVPSQTPPQAPQFSYSTILCPDGSSVVN